MCGIEEQFDGADALNGALCTYIPEANMRNVSLIFAHQDEEVTRIDHVTVRSTIHHNLTAGF